MAEGSGLSAEIERLVQEYQTPLLRYVGARLGRADLAQDVVQDTFLRFVHHRRNGGEVANVRAWLYRVAYNRALDYLRKDRRVQAFAEDFDPPAEGPAFAAPNVQAEQRDTAAAAWQLLDTLSERDRHIVLLKVLEEKSYQEIAATMGVTVTNVGFILHTSLKKLARALAARTS